MQFQQRDLLTQNVQSTYRWKQIVSRWKSLTAPSLSYTETWDILFPQESLGSSCSPTAPCAFHTLLEMPKRYVSKREKEARAEVKLLYARWRVERKRSSKWSKMHKISLTLVTRRLDNQDPKILNTCIII